MRRLIFLVLAIAACRQPDPPPIGAGPFTDDFERAEIGSSYRATADVYRIKEGALNVSAAYNHPLWLRRKLPENAAIELDAWSRSPAGDIKLEIWGDGESFAETRGAYTSTGYVFVFGGWGNSKSIIARGNEHGKDVVSRTEPKVTVGKKYHFKIVRKGGRIDWFIDDPATPFLSIDDPQPLSGAGHEYLGLNDWEADLWFDNLSIRKLD